MDNDIENYLDSFAIVAPVVLKQANYRRGLARLMIFVNIMQEDGGLRPEESDFLIKLACERFGLEKASGRDLCDEMMTGSDCSPSLSELGDYIKSQSTLVERADCVRELWEVASCNVDQHQRDDQLAYRFAALLDVEVDEVSWLQELAVSSSKEPHISN